jgi:hypothetical protein
MKFFFYLLPLMAACGSPDTPLDADTRKRIDSIATEHIRLARNEMDSLCQQSRSGKLPGLVDSIRQIRLQEIEQQLKTIPR